MPGSTNQITGSSGLPTLELWNGATYDFVAEIVNVDGNEPSVGSHDTTSTDISDNHKTFLPGWVEAGEYSFTTNYREDTYEQILATVGDGTVHQWRVAWTDPGAGSVEPSKVIQAFITTGPKINKEMEDRWTLDFTMKISGKPEFIRGG